MGFRFAVRAFVLAAAAFVACAQDSAGKNVCDQVPAIARGLTGYDPHKKKYVSTWADSVAPHLMVMEGSFADDGKTFTETGEGMGPDAKLQKLKSVYEFKDKDTIVFTMYKVEGGKDEQMMQIIYKRKK